MSSTYKYDLLEELSNQNNEELEETNEADYELNEISKAADLINIYNNFDLKETDNLVLKQSKKEIDFMYNQSSKRIIILSHFKQVFYR